MKAAENRPYKARTFDLTDLKGISIQTVEMHFKLYEGYVAQTNLLRAKIGEILADGRIEDEEQPAYSELKRRLGFEYNGMVLHEYYFENLKRGGGDPQSSRAFSRAVTNSFGSFEVWKTDFVNVGKLRGVGWAICYLDPSAATLSNHWVTLHEAGHIAGYRPVLVMDVWEHAYLLDYKPAERGKYIDAFFENVDWSCVERRVSLT